MIVFSDISSIRTNVREIPRSECWRAVWLRKAFKGSLPQLNPFRSWSMVRSSILRTNRTLEPHDCFFKPLVRFWRILDQGRNLSGVREGNPNGTFIRKRGRFLHLYNFPGCNRGICLSLSRFFNCKCHDLIVAFCNRFVHRPVCQKDLADLAHGRQLFQPSTVLSLLLRSSLPAGCASDHIKHLELGFIAMNQELFQSGRRSREECLWPASAPRNPW